MPRPDDDDATELPYHIEAWNGSGKSWVWVNVTRIDEKSNLDHIYMYYNNSDAADVRKGQP